MSADVYANREREVKWERMKEERKKKWKRTN
jgi:hypothetical protein